MALRLLLYFGYAVRLCWAEEEDPRLDGTEDMAPFEFPDYMVNNIGNYHRSLFLSQKLLAWLIVLGVAPDHHDKQYPELPDSFRIAYMNATLGDSTILESQDAQDASNSPRPKPSPYWLDDPENEHGIVSLIDPTTNAC
jgi:hypothetical protein